MKLNLKNMNWKQLAIDHGEKLVLAIVALLSLMFVAGAEWAPEKRTPEELLTKVDQGSKKVEASPWPDAEKAKYTSEDKIGNRVTLMRSPIQGNYGPSTDTIWPLIKRHEPIKEPEWLAAEDLRVTPGQVILLQSSKSAAADVANVEAAEGQPQNPGNDALLPKKDRKAGPGAGMDLPRGRPGDSAVVTGGAGSAAGASGSETVQGRHFVAVRGVLPIARQADRIAKARNESPMHSRQLLEYLDFHLERQRAVAGADPWAGPWQPIDMKVAQDILYSANAFELDPVDPAVTDPVITMPLPERVAGSWDPYVTHPRVKDFELTEEGREQMERLTQQVNRLAEDLKAQIEAAGPQPGGFLNQKQNVRKTYQRVIGNREAAQKIEDMIAQNSQGEAVNVKEYVDKFKKVSAGGTLLLFRYLDFDVEPGNAYRYRVRFIVRNPNAGLPPDQVVAPFVAEKETRETPWSPESDVAVVAEDVNYFLSRIEQSRSHGLPTAVFDIHQWNEKTGTPVEDDKAKAVVGQRIGGPAKATIVAPPVKVQEEGDFAFNTGDFLVDLSDSSLVEDSKFSSFHTDLKLTSDPRAKASLVDKALVVNDYGELVLLDSFSLKALQTNMHAAQREFIRIWTEALGDGKNKLSAADDLARQAGVVTEDTKNKKDKRLKDSSRKTPAGGSTPPGVMAPAAAYPTPGSGKVKGRK